MRLALQPSDPAPDGGCSFTRRLLHLVHLGGGGSGCSPRRKLAAPRSLLNLPTPVKKDRYEPNCKAGLNFINSTADIACYGNATYRAANPGALGLCCDTINFWCGVRVDTGGPRCAHCPGTCISTCQTGLGHQCGLDVGYLCRPGGAWDCLANCTATSQCSPGKLCHKGFCNRDPCSYTACPAEAPTCRTTAAMTAACEAPGVRTCAAADPCPAGSFCDAGVCRDPCAGTACPAEAPACRMRPDTSAACEPEGARTCGADDPCPKPDQLCTADGVCRTNPCSSQQCPEGAPKCTVGPAPEYAAACTAECSGALPCPTAKFCAGGACHPNPCAGYTCPEEQPACSVGPAPRYSAVCSAVVPVSRCSPPCADSTLCVKSGGGASKWQCSQRPRRAQPLRRAKAVRRMRRAAPS